MASYKEEHFDSAGAKAISKALAKANSAVVSGRKAASKKTAPKKKGK